MDTKILKQLYPDKDDEIDQVSIGRDFDSWQEEQQRKHQRMMEEIQQCITTMVHLETDKFFDEFFYMLKFGNITA